MEAIPVKLVLIGDSSVGKTTFISTFLKREHGPTAPTVGACFFQSLIHSGEKTFELEIWDTAGQEIYRAIVPQYARGAHGAILVYDITDKKSFLDMDEWYKFVQAAQPEIRCCMFGNKEDLESSRAVSFAEAEAWAKGHEILFFEGSAYSGNNVEDSIVCLLQDISKNIVPEEPAPAGVELDVQETIQKKNCC